MSELCTNIGPTFRRAYVVKYWFRNRYRLAILVLGDFDIDIDIGIHIEMAQSAISFSVLVSESSFHIIDFDVGFGINACQPEILISN